MGKARWEIKSVQDGLDSAGLTVELCDLKGPFQCQQFSDSVDLKLTEFNPHSCFRQNK